MGQSHKSMSASQAGVGKACAVQWTVLICLRRGGFVLVGVKAQPSKGQAKGFPSEGGGFGGPGLGSTPVLSRESPRPVRRGGRGGGNREDKRGGQK